MKVAPDHKDMVTLCAQTFQQKVNCQQERSVHPIEARKLFNARLYVQSSVRMSYVDLYFFKAIKLKNVQLKIISKKS